MFDPVSISANFEWYKISPDGSRCSNCGEFITSEIWQMVLFLNYKAIYTEVKLCQSCYDIKNDSEKR